MGRLARHPRVVARALLLSHVLALGRAGERGLVAVADLALAENKNDNDSDDDGENNDNDGNNDDDGHGAVVLRLVGSLNFRTRSVSQANQ